MSLFRVIIIDNSIESRAMLKSAARLLGDFSEIVPVPSANEAIALLTQGKMFDIAIISSKLLPDDIANFMVKIREQPGGKESVFVLFVKSDGLSESDLASRLAEGFSSILCEPFSADQLKESTYIASRLKIDGCLARIRAALSIIVPALARRARSINAADTPPTTEREYEKLLETCRKLRELTIHIGVSYDNIVNEFFEKLDQEAASSYLGASKKIQERYATIREVQIKLRQELVNIS